MHIYDSITATGDNKWGAAIAASVEAAAAAVGFVSFRFSHSFFANLLRFMR